MTFAELITEVQNIVQDSAWTETMIKALLNRAQTVVASGVILPGKYQLTPPLPDLYATGTVDTIVGAGACSLPEDFNRDLIQVVNSDEENVSIIKSFRRFLTDNPEREAGSVRICARNGQNLLYRDIPSTAETLTVHYYRSPEELLSSSDEPEGIPVELHKPLLAGYAAAQIFNQIEDGIEGQKINTSFWNNEFQQGLIQLEIMVGFDADPDYYEDLSPRVM
jgi:hypothetical protein